jgi:hypothetical protein
MIETHKGALEPAFHQYLAEARHIDRAVHVPTAERARTDRGTCTGATSSAGATMEISWMTTTEAAAQLGVTARAIRARCNRGTLASELRGGRWQIDPHTIEGQRP